MIRYALLCLVLLLTGCGSSLTIQVEAVNQSQAALVSASSAITTLEAHELGDAVNGAHSRAEAQAAVQDVVEQWRPAWDGYDMARLSWIAARDATSAALDAEAAGLDVDTGHIITVVDTLVHDVKQLVDLVRLVESRHGGK